MLCNESTQNILTKLILENLRKALSLAIYILRGSKETRISHFYCFHLLKSNKMCVTHLGCVLLKLHIDILREKHE